MRKEMEFTDFKRHYLDEFPKKTRRRRTFYVMDA